MKYTETMHALDMIWQDKPRLDILACREEAYTLLDPALQELSEFTFNSLHEEVVESIGELSDEQLSDFEEAISDSVGFGVDLYLGCMLAAKGRLVATGREPVQTDKVLKAIEQHDLQLAIMERFELVPLLLRDFSQERLETLADQITELGDLPWGQVNDLRQSLLALSTTTFLITVVHLEGMYTPPASSQ